MSFTEGVAQGHLLAAERGRDGERYILCDAHATFRELAEVVARQYGTQHSTWTLSGQRFRDELPKALEAMDQPSIDGLNSYFVCKAAAELGWKPVRQDLGVIVESVWRWMRRPR